MTRLAILAKRAGTSFAPCITSTGCWTAELSYRPYLDLFKDEVPRVVHV